MTAILLKKVETFRGILRRLSNLTSISNQLYWDMITFMPPEGIEQRALDVAMVSTDLFDLSVSPQMADCLDALERPEAQAELDDALRAAVRECRRTYRLNASIPTDLYEAFATCKSQSEMAWQAAKRAGDFAHFAPYLTRMVDFQRQFVELWGYEGHPYNALLDQFEPGLTVSQFDGISAALRAAITPLLSRIQAAGPRGLDVMRTAFPRQGQERLGRWILQEMGFDFDRGRLDESEHPMTCGSATYDVRMTTHYHATGLDAIFSCLHEGGHGLYMQGMDEGLNGTTLTDGASCGMHESQSRFYENFIGRSLAFWRYAYPEAQRCFPDALGQVPLEDFYAGINRVQSNPIRIEADEVTYNLHIMLRYELEKRMLDGSLSVADVRDAWRELSRDYLGLIPADDRTGVLQDVHWAGDLMGYFPSYTMGNLYAAQFYEALCREAPDLEAQLARGNLGLVRDWLQERIHRFGKTKRPDDLLRDVTGKGLDPTALTRYFEGKYAAIYAI